MNKAVTIHNKLREAIIGSYKEMSNLIFCDWDTKLVLPNGGVHPITYNAMRFILFSCRSRKNLEPILQEYLKDADGAGTLSSFSVQMLSVLKLLERQLKAKSKNYEDPALRCVFMMDNRRYIENEFRKWNLGTQLSDDWIRNNTAKVQKNFELHHRRSWNKVLDFLNPDDNEPLAPNAVAESMKEKLNLFNTHLKEISTVQSAWFVNNEQLREEIITSLENMLLPAYGNFIGRFHDVVAANAYKYIKYGMFDIEARLKGLFGGRRIGRLLTKQYMQSLCEIRLQKF